MVGMVEVEVTMGQVEKSMEIVTMKMNTALKIVVVMWEMVVGEIELSVMVGN